MNRKDYYRLYKEWNFFLKRILQKDIRCGLSEKTINNVAKKNNFNNFLIPVFSKSVLNQNHNFLFAWGRTEAKSNVGKEYPLWPVNTGGCHYIKATTSTAVAPKGLIIAPEIYQPIASSSNRPI